jgi:hypothetical protein
MSKFDAVYKRIEEMLPVTPSVAGTQPKPAPSAAAAQQPPLDPKVLKQLQDAIAAADNTTAPKTLETIIQALNLKPGQQPVPNQQPAV